MSTLVMQDAFEARVCRPCEVSTDIIEDVARKARSGDSTAIERLSAILARVAFVTPEAVPAVYDALTRGWQGFAAEAFPTAPCRQSGIALLSAEAELPAPFWQSFWQLMKDGANRLSPAVYTARVAAIAAHLPEVFHSRAEAAAVLHPGCSDVAERQPVPPIRPESLAALPPGSLGHDFYRLVRVQNFDLEVLDRRAPGFDRVPPGLFYLNCRILQMHDIWHLAGGYTTSALHENALASFQLAQFGHTYSAMYLASVVLLGHLSFPHVVEPLLQVITEAWIHSRQCPAFMSIEWEKEWHLPAEEVRRRHAIPAFSSIYSQDLFEQGAVVVDHPIFKAICRLDRWLGLSLEKRLLRGAIRLDVRKVANARTTTFARRGCC